MKIVTAARARVSDDDEMNFFKRLVVLIRSQKSRRRRSRASSASNPTVTTTATATATATAYSNASSISIHNSNPRQDSTAARAPPKVLLNIFSFICPHALDHSYESAENSITEAGCMLCGMRDLARVGLVCKEWHRAAQVLQYRSIRLDTVHYCGMEGELQARRKRSSFFQKQSSPLEIPEQRMRLLYRTFQERESIAMLVWLLKIPYMTRETCKQDLARLVSLLPNLRYVDLPDGIYHDDSSCASLKAILYTRCPDLRKMTWLAGSEKNFVDLWSEPPWLSLEIVELSGMKVENESLVQVLASLPNLKHLKLKSMEWTSDDVFDPTFGQFPVVENLELEGETSLTIDGLSKYLSRPEVSQTLKHLTLTNTSISAHLLYRILLQATSLTSLSLRETVARTIPRTDVHLISSSTLRSLTYEIIDDDSRISKPSTSYYAYLSESLWDGGLPSLIDLYVRETKFHQRFQNDRASAGVFTIGGWTQRMTVCEKGPEHMDWTKYRVGTIGNGNLLVSPIYERPRSTVFMPDFDDINRASMLTVPGSGTKSKRSSRSDLWR